MFYSHITASGKFDPVVKLSSPSDVYLYINICLLFIYKRIYFGIVRLSASSFVGVSIPNLQQKGVG